MNRIRFCLYSQPVRATHGDDGVPAYTELLLRLCGDDGELVPPTAFIPAAERYHMMPAIDRSVISTAFATLARYQGARGTAADAGVCAINVSGASLGDDEFLGFVQQQFVKHGIPHSQVCFEITETTVVASLTKANEFMTALRGAGCRFALDDFGVGVSSFTYLEHLPVDYLEIDGSFVRDMLDDPVNHAMVEAIHRIGHIMGKKTIAESVEKARDVAGAARDRRRLRARLCDRRAGAVPPAASIAQGGEGQSRERFLSCARAFGRDGLVRRRA